MPTHSPTSPISHRPSRRRLGLLALGALTLPALTARAQPAGRGDILIGRSTPTSGGMAPFMVGILGGQEAAFADVNAQGGIGGRLIKLLTLDDGFDVKRALANARTLVEQENVVALFGFTGTSQVAAVLPFAAEKKVPVIGAVTGSPGLRAQPHPTFFTTSASYADELVKIVRNLVSVEQRRIAVVYQDNDFGRLLMPLVQKVVAAEGAELVASRAMEVSGKDSDAVATSFVDAKPNAVLLLAAGQPTVAYVKSNRALLGVPVYTLSVGVGTALLAALGTEARGLAVARNTPFPWQARSALTREFQASMKRHSRPVDYDHFIGYIDARVLIEGLKAAGRDVTRASLVSGLESLGTLDLGGYVLNYSPTNHHGSRFVEIAVVGPTGNFMR